MSLAAGMAVGLATGAALKSSGSHLIMNGDFLNHISPTLIKICENKAHTVVIFSITSIIVFSILFSIGFYYLKALVSIEKSKPESKGYNSGPDVCGIYMVSMGFFTFDIIGILFSLYYFFSAYLSPVYYGLSSLIGS